MGQLCEFVEEVMADGRYRYRCRHAACGNTVVSAKRLPRLFANCKTWHPSPADLVATGPSSTGPSAFQRLSNFSRAAIGHYLAGSPTCTDAQILARLAICKSCTLFAADAEQADVGVCTHRSCGCRIARERRYLNKLAWSDQSCPLGLWAPIEVAEESDSSVEAASIKE
jgi:hypothetical protein